MTYGHLQADCLYTGISSGPNACVEYGKHLPFFLLCRAVFSISLCTWMPEAWCLQELTAVAQVQSARSQWWSDVSLSLTVCHMHFYNVGDWWGIPNIANCNWTVCLSTSLRRHLYLLTILPTTVTCLHSSDGVLKDWPQPQWRLKDKNGGLDL